MADKFFSLITLKSVDKAKREFSGWATTPDRDLVNDVVDPFGASFENPTPLLWQHETDKPIGSVKFGTPTEKGIPFTATIASVEEPGVLKDRLDEAWHSIKAGLIKAVSVGMRVTDRKRNASGGYDIAKYFIYELSAVTFPANVRATIEMAKSLDTNHDPAATGNGTNNEKAGDAAHTVKRKKLNFSNKIAELESELAEITEARDVLLSKSLDSGLTAEEDGEYDATEARVADLTKSLERVRKAAGEAVAKATPITNVKSFAAGSALRARVPAQPKVERPKGHGFTKYAMAIAASKGNLLQAAEIVKGDAFRDTPEVETIIKAAVAAGTTTDASFAKPLVEYQTLQNEFVDLLRDATILGRIPNFRRVPFNVRLVGQTSGSSVNWNGETKPAVVSGLTFDAQTLGFNKLAGIVVFSEELAKFSDPAIVSIVQGDLVAAIAGFVDAAALDPTKAAVAGVSPASLTHGVTPIAASGKTADHARADVQKVYGTFLASKMSAADGYWIMSGTQALALSMLRHANTGAREFPEMTMTGGVFEGLPVIVSEAPVTQGRIVLVKPSEILLAEEGIVMSASGEASIIMDSDPARTGAPAPVNLWQHGLLGIKAERFISWGKRRPGVVAVISGASYGIAS